MARVVYAPALLVALPLLGGAAAAILGLQRLPADFAFLAAGGATLLWVAACACLRPSLLFPSWSVVRPASFSLTMPVARLRFVLPQRRL